MTLTTPESGGHSALMAYRVLVEDVYAKPAFLRGAGCASGPPTFRTMPGLRVQGGIRRGAGVGGILLFFA